MASQFGNGNIIVVTDDRFFDVELDRAGKKLVVVDFTASWCGPCKKIAPTFVQLSVKYMSVTFLKVDVDQCPFSAESNGIHAMPTFLFFRSKTKVGELRGADPLSLENKIKELSGLPSDINNHIVVDPKRVGIGRSWSCFKELQANEASVFMETSEVILKFASNLLNHPENKKYRSIRIGNKIFQSKLLPAMGGVECLFAMGFEEQDDYLVFPSHTSMDALTTLRDAIYDERSKKHNSESSPCGGVHSLQTTGKANIENTGASSSISTQGMSPAQIQFYAKLKSSSDHVMLYEDPDLQRRARAVIPVSKLESKAQTMNQNTKGGTDKGIHARDCLILVLLDWFKNEFFEWVDKPGCGPCKTVTQFQGIVPPSSEEERWGAGNVESYKCPKCHHLDRFPRYNSPAKLLETRRGRCGEWANLFTLLCRCLGYETRFVLDWTDHVWTEIFSECQQRWLHCDACESTCDKPLLYEAGWGKRLTYVIAFSREEIFDVTWRYSANHDQVRLRRQEVSENWLVTTVTRMTQQLQKSIPEERRQMVQARAMKELIEFMTPKPVSNEELQGRTSGSLAWRTMRWELGPGNSQKFTSYTFKPTTKEIEQKRIRIRYCTSSDGYYRCTDDTIAEDVKADLVGWKSGAHAEESMFRKVESDWKMAYLARNNGKPTGSIKWKIDVSDTDHVIDDVTIVACSTAYEDGVVDWTVYGDDKERQKTVLNGGSGPQTLFSLHGSKTLLLTTHLSGGKGDIAWQHAQLFRQSLHSSNEYPLEVDVKLVKKATNAQ